MSEIEIRRVLPGDAALFDRVADEVFDEAVDTERIAKYLAEPGHHMVVALHDGVIVGQTAAVVHRHPDKPTELYIDEVGVAGLSAPWNRTAHARAMLAHGKAIGCAEAWVGTEPDNLPATRTLRAAAEGRRRSG